MSKRAVFGLFGVGGFAREVMPCALEVLARVFPENNRRNGVYFVDSNPAEKEVNGIPVISEEEFFLLDCEERLFNITIADSSVRARVAAECLAKGAKPLSVVSNQALRYDANEVGEGAILCAFSMITSNAKIGRFFHSNLFSYVAHDCQIGDFVTFAPAVRCNGNVHVHDHVYIGTGAVLKQGLPGKPLVIGAGAVIGMGAVVTRDVPPNMTVVGNPAKPFLKA